MSRKRRTPAASPGWTPPSPDRAMTASEIAEHDRRFGSAGDTLMGGNETRTQTAPPPLESGAGELSVADKAAILGLTASEYEAQRLANQAGPRLSVQPMIDMTTSVSEFSSFEDGAGIDMPDDDGGLGQQIFVLATRLATLEHRVEQFEKAVEKGFAARVMFRQPPPHEPGLVLASPAEQDAYAAENYRRFKTNGVEKQFDGIAAWIGAGRPGLAA